VRASATPLSALEVTVRGRGAALARAELVGIHAETHRASRLAPLESGVEKHLVEALSLGLALHAMRSRNHEGPDAVRDAVAGGDAGRCPQVLDSRVGARADEHHVDCDRLHLGAGFEAHVSEGPFSALALVGVAELVGRGNDAVERHDLGRVCSPRDEGDQVGGAQRDLGVEFRVVVAGEGAPTRGRGFEAVVFGHAWAPPEVVDGGLVGRHEARARARLDAHVAQRHAAFHREGAHRIAAKLDDVTRAATGAEVRDDREREILRADAVRGHALERDGHGLGALLGEGLGREHVLHLARADAEGQGAECAVGGGVRVTTDDGHPRLGHAEFGSDDVDDSLVLVAAREQGDAELSAVLVQRLELSARDGVLHRCRDRVGGHVVVRRREGPVRSTDAATLEAQAVEGLGTRDLVHEVQVDVQQRRLALGGRDDVLVPDLLEERATSHGLAQAHDFDAKHA